MSDLEKLYREMMSEPMVIHPDPAMDLFGKYQTQGTVTGRLNANAADIYHQKYMTMGRQLGKSQMIQAMYGAKLEPKGHPMYVFHHKHGYVELEDVKIAQAPNHCYFLYRNQWYKKTSEHKVRAIQPDKVPKEHRLMLKINHIKQPGD